MDINKYRFKNNYISYEELITSVFEYLSENRFQDHIYIADKCGSRPSIIEQAIEDGIIRITKQYKEENGVDISFSYLCKTYGVKMSYIDSLIDQGRIEIKNDSTAADLEEIKQQEKEARRNQQLNNLREMSKSLTPQSTQTETPMYRTKGAFHSFNHDIKRR